MLSRLQSPLNIQLVVQLPPRNSFLLYPSGSAVSAFSPPRVPHQSNSTLLPTFSQRSPISLKSTVVNTNFLFSPSAPAVFLSPRPRCFPGENVVILFS